MNYELSGTNLTAMRDRAGLSRQAAASAIGISISALQTAERGDTELRASKLMNLADLYGCPLEAFFIHAEDGTDPVDEAPEVPENAKSVAL